MHKRNLHSLPALLLLAFTFLPLTAQALGTAAGTDISNTASASYVDSGGNPQTATSNTNVVRVNEVIDLTIAYNGVGATDVNSPAVDVPMSFTLTNIGNGTETFALTASGVVPGDDFDPANVRIFIDGNNDGDFDPGIDPLYVPGINDPTLNANAALIIFVVSDIPLGQNVGDSGLASLTAESTTAQTTPGAETPGTVFAGLGAGGTDAVVGGSTTSQAIGQSGYAVVSTLEATLAKSDSVTDQFGGNSAIPGATITYTLVFDVPGNGTLTNVQIVDAIPANTTYVANSLTLNDGVTTSALTDVADADAGNYTGSGVEVNVGAAPGPATYTVTFKVTIN